MKKRNKSYRPRHIQVDPVSWAIAGCHLFLTDTIKQITAPVKDAFVTLKQGKATRDDWNMIVQALNVAEALCGAQIGPNLLPKIEKAQVSLKAIALRMCDGDAACKAPELAAVNEGIAMYCAQLKVCSQAEFGRALAYTKEMHRCGNADDVARVYLKMAPQERIAA